MLIVQKYGGTSVGDVDRIRNVAKRVLKTQAQGHDVVVVLSAMSGETNRLVALASEINPLPFSREYDMLVASGEHISSCLVTLAINTEAEALFAGDVAESLVGADHVVRDLEPSMGAEDFSFMLQTKPGAYLRIGQGTGSSGSALHNSRYDFNDDILPLGSALHASLIEQAMPLPTP